jgi:hypothetical protein
MQLKIIAKQKITFVLKHYEDTRSEIARCNCKEGTVKYLFDAVNNLKKTKTVYSLQS